MQITRVLAKPDCHSCPIRHRAVCASCDEVELKRLEEMKYYRTFEAGQTVVWRDDPMVFVASVVQGVATLEHLTEDGRKQTVGLLLASDFLGRPGRETALYDVTAVTDVTLCCFHRRQFERLIEDTPHVAQRMLEMALDELDAARDWMFLLGRKTARERIASFLLHLVRRTRPDHFVPQGERVVLDLPLTRQAMAEYLGLTIETVSRQFSALKKDGLIELKGKRGVTIVDVDRLKEESAA